MFDHRNNVQSLRQVIGQEVFIVSSDLTGSITSGECQSITVSDGDITLKFYNALDQNYYHVDCERCHETREKAKTAHNERLEGKKLVL